ncbi:hypothetical protein G9A89_016871 [Geosiphon pyriformis]|nr:hypothetical protein G9A89_016871 [Geosiphon pyriformis]
MTHQIILIQRPDFPPDLTPQELLENAFKKLNNTGKVSRVPNQWMAYRSAILKDLSLAGHRKHINMKFFSTIASQLWEQEPNFVKEHYKNLSKKASLLFQEAWKKSHLQIRFMNQNKNSRPKRSSIHSTQNIRENLPKGDGIDDTQLLSDQMNYNIDWTPEISLAQEFIPYEKSQSLQFQSPQYVDFPQHLNLENPLGLEFYNSPTSFIEPTTNIPDPCQDFFIDEIQISSEMVPSEVDSLYERVKMLENQMQNFLYEASLKLEERVKHMEYLLGGQTQL